MKRPNDAAASQGVSRIASHYLKLRRGKERISPRVSREGMALLPPSSLQNCENKFLLFQGAWFVAITIALENKYIYLK